MNNKNLPILIILLVLVVAVIGGVMLYRNQSTGTVTNSNKPANKASTQDFANLIAKAPSGAQPPWSKGDPAAKVTIEEFADFACPTCAQFHQTLKEIEKSYGARVRVVFRHYPLQIKGHENAYDAARATEAAGLQGRFWEMQNMLFSNQEKWRTSTDPRKIFEEYAGTIGIDVQRFNTDLVGQTASARVAEDMKRGQGIKISSTPTVVLNNRPLSMSEFANAEALRQVIEAEMQKAAAANQPSPNAQNSANQNTP